jgi:hypothetical protein
LANTRDFVLLDWGYIARNRVQNFKDTDLDSLVDMYDTDLRDILDKHAPIINDFDSEFLKMN